jgi:hypothetical protein
LAANAEVIDVREGEGMRLQPIGATTVRYFRLLLTSQLGEPITLFRVGGQSGLLDAVRVEGGIQGTLDTKYDRGGILLPSSREDVVFVVPKGKKGTSSRYGRSTTERPGPIRATQGSPPCRRCRGSLPDRDGHGEKLPRAVEHARNFKIVEGEPVHTHPESRSLPVEDLKTLATNGSFLGPKTFTPAQPGSANQTIGLRRQANPRSTTTKARCRRHRSRTFRTTRRAASSPWEACSR